MPSRYAGTRAGGAGKRGACCRGTQGARGDACWGTRDACCRSLGPCCKRGKGQALPHPHRRPRTRGLRSAQGKPVMADAGRGRACRRDARDACCGGGTRARAHAEKRACQRHKKRSRVRLHVCGSLSLLLPVPVLAHAPTSVPSVTRSKALSKLGYLCVRLFNNS